MFKAVDSKVNFTKLEEKILKWWQEKTIFERSVAQRRGAPSFILYDGPPTANGSPALHHVLTSTFKDVIPRYKAMKGFYTPRIAGWDTHGLPVELEVEKQLGFSGKTQIEEYGVARFNEKCRQSVTKYIGEFRDVIERAAYWVDLNNAYFTMSNEYIESGWWAIKRMWDKGLIYQGYRVTPHCPRCGTSLSSHEVAQGYQDNVEDPSVFVKFKIAKGSIGGSPVRDRLFYLLIASDKPAYFLAWTTTPWTLPGNTALAVSADAEYVVIETQAEFLVLASARLFAVGLAQDRVVAKLKGGDLVGGGGKEALQYDPLYNPHAFGVERYRLKAMVNRDVTSMQRVVERQAPDKDLRYKVIATDFVSMEDGTGIVHVAPAFGEADFDAGLEHDLDFVQPVDLQGKVMGNYPFGGKFVKTADPLIIEDLKSRELLFRAETIRHTYPFCWRCETPLLYYVKNSWYIKTTAVKERLIAGNNEINWYPEHIKQGRFGDWLENNVDWAFSRERYWGTPVPVWYCESCCRYECVGSLDELKTKPGFSGFPEPLDLHRPFVDDVTFKCSYCSTIMRRVPEVVDCWFDSGNMPIAQFHYPFTNQSIFEDGRFPADYISEAVDQTRGWFYSLHAISTLLFDRVCYKNVICLGHILDAKGEKMSKRKGNVVWPWEIINKYGADALRWYLFTASPPGNARRFDEKIVVEVTRSFLLTLWNVYSFFVMYANIDHYAPGTTTGTAQPTELDRWIISELNQLITDVDSDLEHYDPTSAGRKIERFVDELSTWYVRRSRRRFWKSENDIDKLSAYSTLYDCLITLSKLLAPFMPFLAEELYQNLVCSAYPDAPESVHLADFPVADTGKIDRHLSADTQLVMKIVSLGRAARSKAAIRVRQPLAHVMVTVANTQEQASLERLKSQLLEELNVKDLKFGGFDEVAKLGGYGYAVSGLEPVAEGEEGGKPAGEVYLAAIPTEMSPELAAEGMAREIVHRLQTMRRSANFDITDHIITYYQGDSYIKQVVERFADYIKQETLSEGLMEAVPAEGAYSEKFKLDKHEVVLGVQRH